MKKFLVTLTTIFSVLLAVIMLTPFIFKDDIKIAMDEAIAENINAEVYYDSNGFSLSFLSNFPNLTLAVSDFGITGRDVFAEDTLFSISKFEVELDLISIIQGDIAINSILLDEPKINIVVLPEGLVNYDIVVVADTSPVEEETVDEETSSSEVNFAIKKWEIRNANISYYDHEAQLHAFIGTLNHTGSGDFAQNIFDMYTKTTAENLTFSMEGEEYLSNKVLSADIVMSMDLDNSLYTFKENKVSLNDFGIGFDGSVAMPDEDIQINLNYHGRDISIRSLLSLLPGMYHDEYLSGVQTSGEINFEGYAKGLYNDNTLPDIHAELNVNDGGITYADYPVPMEEIQIETILHVPGDNVDDMTFDMPKFHLLINQDELSAHLAFKNLANYTWDFGMNGKVDLDKLFHIIPLDSMDIKGLLHAEFETSGQMSLVEEEKYDEISAKGIISVTDFYFSNDDLPQGFGIQSSKMTLTPRLIKLEKFDATLGKSDMSLDGSLSNLIGFVLDDEEVLKGRLNFRSKWFNLDELITTETEDDSSLEPETSTAEEEPAEVIKIPKTIDFTLTSSINEMLYDSLIIKDAQGVITIQEGIAQLDQFGFNLLEGDFMMTGLYNSASQIPSFDFNFDINNLSIPAAYEAFNTVQTMAPAAQNMEGSFGTDFFMKGELGHDMTPIYESISGHGIIDIKDGAFKGEKIMSALTKVSKAEGEEITLKDLQVKAEIKEGRVHVEPFDVDIKGRKATISGSNGIDGTLDYVIKSEVPTQQVGKMVNSLASQYVGGQTLIGENILMKFGIVGTYENPKINLMGAESGEGSNESVSDKAKEALNDEITQRKKEGEEKAKAELAQQKKKAEAEAEKLKKEAEEKSKKEAENQKKELEQKAKNKLKKMF